ncbi:S41 family peptidase [Gracilimonas mengyeensis]|uniref:Tricorn protease homolog n=1 Tax=Gracilimonas mengyeensis TaxID=1302730 RepID=A0A521EEE5_9BACT|nr:S41 family peptidase [Gracilimonas mengyeensis]SMO82265.1 C-terminal processing protease CtpA/Prc, contains a PDZ domain [Gracilimonas mengyeensis]
MKYLFSLLIITSSLLGSVQAQDEMLLLRNPAISPDGSAISFSYQGDIWKVPFTGGEANRLTVHEAYESAPRWSPDGESIAFQGSRFGNNDIFVIPAKGGKSERITYYSGSDALWDWTTANDLLFSSNRTFQQVEWDSELQTVSADGGTPIRLMDALGDMPAMSPDGRYIAFVRGSCRISREEYDGPADLDIWLYDTADSSFELITNNSRNDFLPRWKDENTLYFISARSGRYNIYEMEIGGSAKAVTSFKNDGVRHFDVALNGNIVLERRVGLQTLTESNSTAQDLSVRLSSDYRFYPEEHETFTDDIDGYAISPNGKYAALTIRGEIFIKKNDKEVSRTVNVSEHPYRDMSPTWLNDSTVVFSSDRNGNYDLFLARSSDENKTDIFKSLKHEVVQITGNSEDDMNPQISPDGKKIVFQRGRGMLITADISSAGELSNREVLLDGWASPDDVAWSPDSKWLAYSLDDLYFNSEIFIHAADNSKEPVNVSMHPKGDAMPVWSRDGSKLGFVSSRNNGDYDIWFAWLTEEDWLKTEEDRKEGYYFDDEEEASEEESEDDEEEKKEVEPIEIDFENIHERLWQVTSMPGNEFGLVISKDGETFYFTASDPAANGNDLYSVKYDRQELKQLTEGGQNPSGLTLSPDGEKLFALRRGQLNEVSTSGDFTTLPFRANMVINHHEEQTQVFDEAWSALNQGFYDPDFHGDNWNALKNKYRPWALAASTSQDFRYMFNWMLGQMNASHMGIYGSNPEEVQDQQTGLLGIGVEPVSNGVRVTDVVKNSPADREVSKLNEGDIITHVDGQEIEPGTNFYSYFVNDASEQILLQVEGTNGAEREIVIRPTNRLGDELYEEWIDSREKLTEEYSNGRLGYIHVEGMNWPSFERFERELTAQGYDKEGVVIDVRWNGGGWTTDYLMTVLNVKQHAYTIPRGATDDLDEDHEEYREYYPFSERLPLSWWTKPSVAIANESSYSNAEIFSHAFKTLDVGTLVGMPTFGAVISTGGMGLLDGSFVRMPFRAWYVKATDENMENGPAVPDVMINNEPDSKAKGEDPQLKKAVEVLLEEIDS